jgi:fructokinase
MKPLWGIDLGGTKIEGVILMSAEDPSPVCRLRIPSEAEKGYEHVKNQIAMLVKMLSETSGLKPHVIGFGTPGTLDPKTQTLKNSNSVCLNGMPFKKDVEQLLGVPVIIANDANCFALAETHFGAVRERLPEARVVFGVIMGTGVGGGIVVNGKVLNGKQGIAGEWGHIFLDESGGKCYCGRTGCVETILSGPALEKYYKSLSGKALKLPEIMQLYEQEKDPHAENTIKRLLNFFGKGLSTVINILDPDIIILGGGVGNIHLLYAEGVKEVEKNIFNTFPKTLIVKPKLGDSAGVFGAALLTA